MPANNSVVIARNIPLTARLKATEIWVSSDAEITIYTTQFGPSQPIPDLSLEYLESICRKFYYGGKAHQNAIADILLLNGFLMRPQYDEFYYNLLKTINNGEYTVISSPLFL